MLFLRQQLIQSFDWIFAPEIVLIWHMKWEQNDRIVLVNLIIIEMRIWRMWHMWRMCLIIISYILQSL